MHTVLNKSLVEPNSNTARYLSMRLRYSSKKMGVVESNAKDAHPKYVKNGVVDLIYPGNSPGFDLSDSKKGFLTLFQAR
jgi:hypothetical protein